VGDRVEIRVGQAADSMRAMIDRGEAPFDLIFIDADKESYVEYLSLSMQLAHPGTVILADNVVRNGRVMEANAVDAVTRGTQAYNDALAAHPRLDSLILPIIREDLDGLSISIVKPSSGA
jgi:predicted O-methyltransferase YrrM